MRPSTPEPTEVVWAKATLPDIKADGRAAYAKAQTDDPADVARAKAGPRIIKKSDGHVVFLKGEADDSPDVARDKAILRIIKGTAWGKGLRLSDNPADLTKVKAIRPDTKANRQLKQAGDKASDPAEDVARAKAILEVIEEVGRDERLRLWEELDRLRCRSDSVRPFLFEFAYDETNSAEPYPRFVAASMLAGFGRPTRIGPNSLKDISLARYLQIQRGIPLHGPRRLELDPALNGLKVTVAPNAQNDLTFTEILWTILVDYKLSFRLDRTETFVIFPPPPLA